MASISDFSQLVLGESVRFGYNGKRREGTVVKLAPSYLTCETEDGFRSFSFAKIANNVVFVKDSI
jgi:hypothetical protein